ncbi:MAG: biotin--[acetyl-CoA-carboxylase] ligase, partial [Actinobacteria bacterium]
MRRERPPGHETRARRCPLRGGRSDGGRTGAAPPGWACKARPARLLNEAAVARAARSAGIQAPARFVEVTASTNDDLLRLAEEGAPAWTVEVAAHQQEGRGRLGRTWVSTPGSSLLVSVLLRPDLPPADAALLTLAAGACMAVSCSVACGVDVRCEWPNDLMAGERKIGGILAEAKVEAARLAHVVVGVGMNVAQTAEDF